MCASSFSLCKVVKMADNEVGKRNKPASFMRGGGQEITLAKLAEKYIGREDFVFVEVGVWAGLTAQYMLRKFPQMLYYGIDPYIEFYNASQQLCDEARMLAEERLSPFPNAELRLESSVEAAKSFLALSIDLVFIDADHRYESCLQDMQSWWPKTRCVLSGHDFIGDVEKAVEDFCEKMNVVYECGEPKMWWIIKS